MSQMTVTRTLSSNCKLFDDRYFSHESQETKQDKILMSGKNKSK